MENYESLMAGTIYGPVIVPGDSKRSILNMLVEGRADASMRMPHNADEPLTDDKTRILHLWVKQGARQEGENHRGFMRSLGILEGFDVCLEMPGSPEALGNMLGKMINGGSIAMLGIMPDGTSIDWAKVVFQGLFIKGIYGREIFETWYIRCNEGL